MALGMALVLLSMAPLPWQVVSHEYIHPKSQLRVENLIVQMDPAVNVILNITRFEFQRQPVEVSWNGVSDPQAEDMIALYSPANVAPWKTLPVQFLSCVALDPDYLSTGAGKGVFQLLNHRNPYKFVLLRGGVVRPRLVAQSPIVYNSMRIFPSGGHIALHEDQRSVVVQWVSSSPAPQQAQWAPEPPPTDMQSDGVSVPTDTQQSAGDGARDAAAAPGVGRYRFTATSSSVTYKANQMCGYPANATGWMHPGYIHSAMIPGSTLVPGHRYVYHYGKEGSGWSKEHSFLAPIGPGLTALNRQSESHDGYDDGVDGASSNVKGEQGLHRLQKPRSQHTKEKTTNASSFVFLAFNDVAMTNPLLFNNPGRGLNFATNYGENSSVLSTRLKTGVEAGAHLALMVGDLAYALGYGADWDVFGDQFEEVFTQWPMAVGTGNHERDWPHTGDAFGNTARDSGGECNVPFMHRWYTPANAKMDPFTSYYSFNQGPVHFLVLDSETPSSPDTPQGRFVAADLAAVDRDITPWVVVALHRMMLAPATWRRKWVGDVDVMERLQADYEELFHSHMVDVVISGHEHAYARSCPVYRSQCIAASLDPPHPPDNHHLCRSSGWKQRVADTARWVVAGLQRVLAWFMRAGKAGQVVETASGSGAGKTARHSFQARAGGPVYVLAGHAGAGFTHGFPEELPGWVEASQQDVNGYLRFTVDGTTMRMEAVAAMDGSIMDNMTLHIK